MKKNKHILVIDDEEVLLHALRDSLTRNGYTVSVARNGIEGLQKIKKITPDLILLDIIMPEMNGYEFLECLNSHKRFSRVPIIIISNSGQPIEIDRALKLGAVDYLIKVQFSLREVLTKVKKALAEPIEVYSPEDETEVLRLKRDAHEKEKKSHELKTHGKIVLVAEDDLFLRELICKKLKSEGFSVIPAKDGHETLESIQKNRPSVILLDIIMPIKNGFEVLSEIRHSSDSEIKHIPVILLTNLGHDKDIDQGKKLGADDYLIKTSLTTDDIVHKVKMHIHGG